MARKPTTAKPARTKAATRGKPRSTTQKPEAFDAVADALARFDANTKRDEAKLLADPAFMASVEHGERWKRAQRAASEASAPYRTAIAALAVKYAKGLTPESSRQHEALMWAISEAESKAFAEHGFTTARSPQSPAQLLARLRSMAPNWWTDLEEKVNTPRPSDRLWADAEQLRQRDPTLPDLPAKPDAGRDRHAVLIRWCEACESGLIAPLLEAFVRFHATLDAVTVPAKDGSRTVGGVAEAVGLSEAATELGERIGHSMTALFNQHGSPVSEIGNAKLQESDSPSGPWSEVPSDEVPMKSMPIGVKGADAILLAALSRAMDVVAFPLPKWNAMQAARPGADHQRFHAGEVISSKQLASLESAVKMLRVKAGGTSPASNPNTGAISGGRNEDSVQWVRSDDAAKRSELSPDAIRKRAERENWETKRSGRMLCYRLDLLETAWPNKSFRADTSGI